MCNIYGRGAIVKRHGEPWIRISPPCAPGHCRSSPRVTRTWFWTARACPSATHPASAPSSASCAARKSSTGPHAGLCTRPARPDAGPHRCQHPHALLPQHHRSPRRAHRSREHDHTVNTGRPAGFCASDRTDTWTLTDTLGSPDDLPDAFPHHPSEIRPATPASPRAVRRSLPRHHPAAGNVYALQGARYPRAQTGPRPGEPPARPQVAGQYSVVRERWHWMDAPHHTGLTAPHHRHLLVSLPQPQWPVPAYRNGAAHHASPDRPVTQDPPAMLSRSKRAHSRISDRALRGPQRTGGPPQATGSARRHQTQTDFIRDVVNDVTVPWQPGLENAPSGTGGRAKFSAADAVAPRTTRWSGALHGCSGGPYASTYATMVICRRAVT